MTNVGVELEAGDGAAAGHSDPAPSKVVARPWLSRATELGLAAAGGATALSVALLVILSPLPGASASRAAEIGAPLAAALLTFALPRFNPRAGHVRMLLAVVFAALVLFIGPGRLTTLRLRSTLESGDVALRGPAVRLLTERGVREFDGVDLENVDLSKSELRIASFRDANLKAARLDDAIFYEAKFDGADLTNASALGADFYLANPERATGWDTVRCDGNTRMPNGWRCANGRPRLIGGGMGI